MNPNMTTNFSSKDAVGTATEAADRLGKKAYEAKNVATDVAADGAKWAQGELKNFTKELSKVAARSEEIAKESPWATAGAVLGFGILLGAVGYKLFAPKPTVAKLLGIDGLPRAARGTAMKAGNQAMKQYKLLKNFF